MNVSIKTNLKRSKNLFFITNDRYNGNLLKNVKFFEAFNLVKPALVKTANFY